MLQQKSRVKPFKNNIISLEHVLIICIMIQMTIKRRVEDFISNLRSEEKAAAKVRGQI